MVQQAMERKQPLRAHSCHMPMQVDPTRLPPALVPLAHTLATLPGAVALVLGGSQADRGAIASSDWDLVVYYRGTIDWRALAPYGEVHPPGSWGRLMNGGAWLQVGHLHVDVILRDLDVAMHWTTQASVGAYELDALLGYLAGLPTYSLAAELASGHVLAGEVPQVGSMPMALRETAPLRWRFSRDFSLEYARMHADRGNVVGAVGQACKAAMEEAHARLCERGQWTLNEKRLLTQAGLNDVHALFANFPAPGTSLHSWLDAVGLALRAS